MRPAYRQGIASAALLLPATLVGGLLVRELGLPLPGLVSLTLALAAYAVYTTYTREFKIGYLALFATASTISANVPILDRGAAFAGPSVGSILLIEVVALPAVAYLLYDWREWDHVEILLLAYSVWAAISVVFGVGPAKVAGLWFAAYSLLGVLSYAFFRRAVQRGVLSGVDAVALFLFAGAGQAVVAFAQFVNESNFGFTSLGEGANGLVSVSLSSLEIFIGTHISGYMAMSFELANFMVLLLPILLAIAVKHWGDIRIRTLLIAAAVLAAVLVRFSITDAGRGAMLIALGAFLIMLITIRAERWQVAWAAFPVFPAFIRSSVSGNSAEIGGSEPERNGTTPVDTPTTQEPLDTPTATPDTGLGTSSPTTGDTTSGGPPQTSTATDTPTAIDTTTAPAGGNEPIRISVPFFDLTTLGVRFEQYLLGLQMFLNHPLFGVGAANFQLVAMSYDAPYPPGGEFPFPAHSVYIMLLAETGVPGFFFYTTAAVIVVIAGVYYGIKEKALLQLGVVCGLLGTFAFGALDVLQLYYPTGFVPIWSLAGILAGITAGIRLPNQESLSSAYEDCRTYARRFRPNETAR